MVQILRTEQLQIELAKYGRRALPSIRRALATTAAAFVGELRSRSLSGPTASTSVSPRTGALRRGIRFASVQEDSRGYVARVTADRRYAFVHFGPRGRVTEIRPKNAKYLTIPLRAARTAAGVSRGGARSGIWGDTFFLPAKNPGNTVGYIMGRKTKQKGTGAGTAYGNVVPLFALVKSVKVEARVDPRDFLAYLGTTYRNELTRELTALKGKG